jgi:cholest-4-en-3-one 26-monooxygenase
MPSNLTVADIHLTDPSAFADGVPHHWFTYLRTHAPVCWIDEPDGPGFWAVTSHADCTTVNRDYEHFSSAARATFIWELPPSELATQQMLMLNMDPPLHTRYRRLINKGFTPRMVASLREQIHITADAIIDSVIESGHADFVTDIAAQLPLTVIADLLGVPAADRVKMFDWSNQMVGNADPEYQLPGQDTTGPTVPVDQTIATQAAQASFELYAYASELFAVKAANPHDDLMSVLTQVQIDGESLSPLELELFFLLLTVAGNETTRNLISGAMQAFFDHPDQWLLLREDPSLLPTATEEMLRYVSPVMNFRRQSTVPFILGGQQIDADQKVVFFHVSANRDEAVFSDPQRFDITRTPNPHIAFGAGGPHFCLGANLARLEITIMFEHLLARLPDLAPAGPAAHLSSQFINGIKHLPVSFTPGSRVQSTA